MNSAVHLRRDGAVAILELSRPEVLNALDEPAREELLGVIRQVSSLDGVRAVVMTGAGRAFCSGADLRAGASVDPNMAPRRSACLMLTTIAPIIEAITRLDKVVVAAVHGTAAGLGMALVLAADLVVMARDTYLLAPYTNIGLVPDGGTAWFLVQRIGYARAFEMLAEAQRISAERCLELGLVNRVVDREEVLTTAIAWAAQLAERAPLALMLTKRLARLSTTTSLGDVLAIEADLQSICVGSGDSREAIAAFDQKRAPQYLGR